MPNSSTRAKPLAALLLFLFILGLALASYYTFEGCWSSAWDWQYNIPLRLKTMAAIILVSIAVGMSSLVFQTITNNYILTPSIMGLDNLYVFIQTVVIYFWGSHQLVMMSSTSQFLMSLCLMILASVGIFVFMFKGMGHSIYYVVLIGIVFGIAFDGMSNFMQVLIDPDEYAIVEGKMFARFDCINLELLGMSALIIALTSLWIIKDFKKYDVLILGRANSITLGVNYKPLILKTLVAVSILTSASTVLVGPVTFLGILVVSLARLIFPTYRHSILSLGTILVSACILIFGMYLTRLIDLKVPLSVMINLAGGSFFIYLILKFKRI
ncbi:MAG: iron chelate uptake ABC transporter family permease subunit [Akkermansia sp.]